MILITKEHVELAAGVLLAVPAAMLAEQAWRWLDRPERRQEAADYRAACRMACGAPAGYQALHDRSVPYRQIVR